MNGVEYRGMHRRLHLQRFQGDEALALHIPQAAEQGRDAHEVDVFRQLLDPRIDGRLELIAMPAAVPEQLDHLDLPRLGYRHGAGEFDIVLAGYGFRLNSQGEQAADGQGGAENQFTHGVLLAWMLSVAQRRVGNQTLCCGPGSGHCSGLTNEKGWPQPPFSLQVLTSPAVGEPLFASYQCRP
ncbi:hypothetical protein D3C86_1613210 [compost metagenome]